MTLDVTKVQFYTGYDTFKNYSTATGSISVPSQSYAVGQYRSFSTTIALDRTLASTQILLNFSTDATKYYIGSFIQVAIDANFSAQTRCSVSGSTLNIKCYVVNQTGGIVSNTAFILSVEARRFVTPFN